MVLTVHSGQYSAQLSLQCTVFPKVHSGPYSTQWSLQFTVVPKMHSGTLHYTIVLTVHCGPYSKQEKYFNEIPCPLNFTKGQRSIPTVHSGP